MHNLATGVLHMPISVSEFHAYNLNCDNTVHELANNVERTLRALSLLCIGNEIYLTGSAFWEPLTWELSENMCRKLGSLRQCKK